MLFDHGRSFPAFADRVHLQTQRPLQKRDQNATTGQHNRETLSSCDRSIPAPSIVAQVYNNKAIPSKKATIDYKKKATRKPVGEKKRGLDEKKDSHEKKKPQQKKPQKMNKDKQYEEMPTHTAATPVQEANEATLAPECTTETKLELEAARAFVEYNKTYNGKETDQNVLLDDEYGDEIIEHMREIELKEDMKPNASYMDLRDEMDWSARAELMEWLVEVRIFYGLSPEVVFIAVNYFDRFLSSLQIQIQRDRLQLAGFTALFIAAKYECREHIEKEKIVTMANEAFTADELLQAERYMLSALNFQLGWPEPMGFLRRINKADGNDEETRNIAKYFLDITMIDERFIGCPSSWLSAGAYCLARFMLKKNDWVFLRLRPR
jgi:hypothetical protein